jgi:hypothetical protein
MYFWLVKGEKKNLYYKSNILFPNLLKISRLLFFKTQILQGILKNLSNFFLNTVYLLKRAVRCTSNLIWIPYTKCLAGITQLLQIFLVKILSKIIKKYICCKVIKIHTQLCFDCFLWISAKFFFLQYFS